MPCSLAETDCMLDWLLNIVSSGFLPDSRVWDLCIRKVSSPKWYCKSSFLKLRIILITFCQCSCSMSYWLVILRISCSKASSFVRVCLLELEVCLYHIVLVLVDSVVLVFPRWVPDHDIFPKWNFCLWPYILVMNLFRLIITLKHICNFS